MNKIRCLKDALGNWITDKNEVKMHIKIISSFSCCFMSDENCSSIVSMVTDEEVRANLWTLKPFKAPELDGLHTGFFFSAFLGRSG